MRSFRYLLAAVAALAPLAARAGDPVVVELNPSATVGTNLITVGDVALISGGDAGSRARVAKVDLVELKARSAGTVVGRLSVCYRLELAGIDASTVRVTGADRVTVTPARRPVTADEVLAAARAELLRHLPPGSGATVELAQPVAVKLPEVPADERVTITAKPRGRATGRVQMDVTIACGGETLLGMALHVNVTDGPRADPQVQPAAGTVPANPNEVLVRARQRVEVSVSTGGLKMIMTGEAQSDGRLGQTVMVQNGESKKLVPAKVTGAGKLVIELGGTTP
ncbi:flagella basal body P-ring formation protein FlgA [Gemmata sp. JC717]|uniref:flagella basal body P-ring formation protein FlgA n=1 Tax=Gemmata algarum TaxID=2975278 RepID=UPI0021BACB0E|nr:flagella basal body P-ring formation protein FlgA [Gemmata algarum]MDY3556834.1 flagella basal body P-ring formation protein FlgA [Gemmata algarum]